MTWMFFTGLQPAGNHGRSDSRPASMIAPSTLMLSGPSHPVPWPPLQVHHRQDTHNICSERVDDRVWEARDDAPLHGSADRVTSFGMVDNRSATALDLSQERGTEATTLHFVVLRCFVEFALGERMEGNDHFRRARASRSTSSAGRPIDGFASQAASRRSASSAHNLAFSSSDRFSRLWSSRSASRARSRGVSFSASVSSSSPLMTTSFYARRTTARFPRLCTRLAVRSGAVWRREHMGGANGACVLPRRYPSLIAEA